MKSAFTVDVEDGVNIAMRDHFGIQMEPTSRVVTNTNRILDLLEKYNTKATFFTLGQVAEKYPGLIKRMAAEKHEVGVHSYNHLQFFKLTPSEAKEDLYRAKNTIENITGSRVKGFRAPAFSIVPATKWALEIIAGLGFEYDSSIMPAIIDRYGWHGFSNEIQKLKLTSGKNLIEVPLTSIEILGRSIPVGGGGYLRLFPFWFTKMALEKIQKEHLPMVYMHPYEIDTSRYPEYYYNNLTKAPLKTRLRLKSIRYNKETVFPKLEKLLQTFSFDRLESIIEDYRQHNELPETKI